MIGRVFQIKPWRLRIKSVSEKCHVRGCNGTVTRIVEPMLMTPQDRLERCGEDFVKKYPLPPVGPPDAVVCDTRGTADVTIWGCVTEALQHAKTLRLPIAFEFNGKTVVVREGSNVASIVRKWWKAAYGETPKQSLRRR